MNLCPTAGAVFSCVGPASHQTLLIMQPCPHLVSVCFRRSRFAVAVFGAILALLPKIYGADATGTVSGSVSNTATGNLLQGARVEIPQLGLSTLTDNTGSYHLFDVPAGTHEVVASYTALDPQRMPVTVIAGQRATRNFDL